jgi:DNA repair protein RecN (Recombination protein N)
MRSARRIVRLIHHQSSLIHQTSSICDPLASWRFRRRAYNSPVLRELHISNLAVIEDVAVAFDGGFNCLTGQTGAGKSLIIGAFEILLGLRTGGADLLRPGAEEARVSGVFELRDAELVGEIGALVDQTLDAAEPLLITRKLFASGRTGVSVNGQPATAAMVRSVGELLVDIHGQHDHQYLLKPSNQLLILDAFGRCSELRREFAAIHRQMREQRQRQAELSASRTLRQQQLELYEFQAREIDDADPVDGEYHDLERQHRRLSNLARIVREAGSAHAALQESDGSIIERLQMLVHVLTDLAELDDSLAEIVETIRTSTLTLQESGYELARYLGRLDVDGGELARVESRLNTLNRLLAKYLSRRKSSASLVQSQDGQDDPVAQLLAYRLQIGREVERLRGEDDDLDQIDRRIAELGVELQQIGVKLTAARQAAAAKLRPLVEAELAELGMGEATFAVSIEPALNAADVSEIVCGGGFDAVEMLVQTNPGQPARPLRKIASGGELSRIMLALKAILAASDRVSLLVFDEIDANIGGRLGSVIGRKLRELAHGVTGGGSPGGTAHAKPQASAKASTRKAPGKTPRNGGRGQQIVCITHLPQIAAMADRHLRIAKSVTGKGAKQETRTTVTEVTGPERITELAEMMAGKQATATTRKQAEELLSGGG